MSNILASLATAGVISALFGGMLALVKIALSAERRRADDWRTAAQASAAANTVLSSNVEKLVDSVEKMTGTQQEMMRLLRQAVDGRGPT